MTYNHIIVILHAFQYYFFRLFQKLLYNTIKKKSLATKKAFVSKFGNKISGKKAIFVANIVVQNF